MVAVPFTYNATRCSPTVCLASSKGFKATMRRINQQQNALRANHCLYYLTARELSHFHIAKAATLLFNISNNEISAYEADEVTLMRAACCSVLFWNTICNTPIILSLADFE